MDARARLGQLDVEGCRAAIRAKNPGLAAILRVLDEPLRELTGWPEESKP